MSMKLLCVSSSTNIRPHPQHPDDVIEVRSLRLADTGSYVDQDDEVAEVLEDREVVSPSLSLSLLLSLLPTSSPPSLSNSYLYLFLLSLSLPLLPLSFLLPPSFLPSSSILSLVS